MPSVYRWFVSAYSRNFNDKRLRFACFSCRSDLARFSYALTCRDNNNPCFCIGGQRRTPIPRVPSSCKTNQAVFGSFLDAAVRPDPHARKSCRQLPVKAGLGMCTACAHSGATPFWGYTINGFRGNLPFRCLCVDHGSSAIGSGTSISVHSLPPASSGRKQLLEP